jgi:Haem-dependent oxidative N-demethylase, alpha subunit-like
MIHSNRQPRYLPHLAHPEVLQMGLAPLAGANWIETDDDLAHYHRHKLSQRERLRECVYRAAPSSLPAQRELAEALLYHLCEQQGELYHLHDGVLYCAAGDFALPCETEEPLWNSSLSVADDLVLMEQHAGAYRLSAASLCSPSHWRLEEKFGRPLREIHDPIPGFHQALTPRIDRFFQHLRPEYPVVRFNWALQVGDGLSRRPEQAPQPGPGAALYYRTERQSLRRLPRSGAIAFTIRVYLHPLEMLAEMPGALAALFAAIDAMPPPLARYKGFDALTPALARYRALS